MKSFFIGLLFLLACSSPGYSLSPIKWRADSVVTQWINSFKKVYELNNRNERSGNAGHNNYVVSIDPASNAIQQYTANGGFDIIDLNSTAVSAINRKLVEFNAPKNKVSFYIIAGSIYLDYEKRSRVSASSWSEFENQFIEASNASKRGGLKQDIKERSVQGLIQSISKGITQYAQQQGKEDIILLFAVKTFYARKSGAPFNYQFDNYYFIDPRFISNELKNKLLSIQFLTRPSFHSASGNPQWLADAVTQVIDVVEQRNTPSFGSPDCTDGEKEALLIQYKDHEWLKIGSSFRNAILENPCLLKTIRQSDFKEDWIEGYGGMVLKEERLVALTADAKEANWQKTVDFISAKINENYANSEQVTNLTTTLSSREVDRLNDRFKILKKETGKDFIFAAAEISFYLSTEERQKIADEIASRIQVKSNYTFIITFGYPSLIANRDFSDIRNFNRLFSATIGNINTAIPQEQISYLQYPTSIYLKEPKPLTVYSYFITIDGHLVRQPTYKSKSYQTGYDVYDFRCVVDTRIEEAVRLKKDIYSKRARLWQLGQSRSADSRTIETLYRDLETLQTKLSILSISAAAPKALSHNLRQESLSEQDEEKTNPIAQRFAKHLTYRYLGRLSDDLLECCDPGEVDHKHYVGGFNQVLYDERIATLDAISLFLAPVGLDFVAEGIAAVYAYNREQYADAAIYAGGVFALGLSVAQVKAILNGEKLIVKEGKAIIQALSKSRIKFSKYANISKLSDEVIDGIDSRMFTDDVLKILDDDLGSTEFRGVIAANINLVESWKVLKDANLSDAIRKNPANLESLSKALKQDGYNASYFENLLKSKTDPQKFIDDYVSKLGNDGKFVDNALENDYASYVSYKSKQGKMPRDRADWNEASDYFKYDSPIARGNNFNRKAWEEEWYPAWEVQLDNGRFMDGYNPFTKEIISRKATDLVDINESTFINYLDELVRKYAPPKKITTKKEGLIYDQLRANPNLPMDAKLILEIPESNRSFFDIDRYTRLAQEKGITLRFRPE